MGKKDNQLNFEYTAIGLRLKDIRKSLDLTLDYLKGVTGISRSYLSEFERGKKIATSKYLKYLTENHQVNINYVFTGKGSVFISDREEQPEFNDFGKFDEEVKDLLFHIKNIPNAMYEVLGFFSEYKVEKEKLIKSSLLQSGKVKDDKA